MNATYSITARFVVEVEPMVAAGAVHNGGLRADGRVVAAGLISSDSATWVAGRASCRLRQATCTRWVSSLMEPWSLWGSTTRDGVTSAVG